MSTESDRRRFMRLLALGGLNLSGGLLGSALPIGTASASCDKSWGVLNGTQKNYRVLEIFLDRGASQWETFWLPGTRQAPGFRDHGLDALGGTYSNLSWTHSAHKDKYPCNVANVSDAQKLQRPGAARESAYFGLDENRTHIHWGAPAKPIFVRPDVLNRCRMVTQFHDVEPHEAAIPFGLAGMRLGNPRRVGSGAAIQKRFCHETTAPISFILHSHSRFTADMAAATGQLESVHRPIIVQVGDSDQFVLSLGRNRIGSASDDLLKALRDEFGEQLRFNGAAVRSPGFAGYSAAVDQLTKAKSLQRLFPNGSLVVDRSNYVCAELANVSEINRRSIRTTVRAAADLLAKGASRYVCVIDPGRAGDYDTHSGGSTSKNTHLLTTSASLFHTLFHVANAIKGPDNPGGKIDLNDTMIVINSEFGRTPGINSSSGRDHWPFGYTTLLIGGPNRNTGASIKGAIDDQGYTLPDHRYTPADVRAAVLLAAGVDPFATGLFRFSDFGPVIRSGIAPPSASDTNNKYLEQVRGRLRSQVLGA